MLQECVGKSLWSWLYGFVSVSFLNITCSKNSSCISLVMACMGSWSANKTNYTWWTTTMCKAVKVFPSPRSFSTSAVSDPGSLPLSRLLHHRLHNRGGFAHWRLDRMLCFGFPFMWPSLFSSLICICNASCFEH